MCSPRPARDDVRSKMRWGGRKRTVCRRGLGLHGNHAPLLDPDQHSRGWLRLWGGGGRGAGAPPFPASTPPQALVKDYGCSSPDIPLGTPGSLSECSRLCRQRLGCRFFTWNGSHCTWDTTGSPDCPEGWDLDNKVEFYEVRALQTAVSPSRCSGHGVCTSSGCVCHRSGAAGYWDGRYCSDCLVGYAGGSCTIACQGGPCAPLCNGHGVCSEGIGGNGSCTCDANWAPPSCSSCAEGFFGPNCSQLCPRSPTNEICHGHGSCVAGVCVCLAGWTPSSDCSRCDASRTGPSCELHCRGTTANGTACSGHGKCLPADGSCLCDEGWTGVGCETPCDCNGHGACSRHVESRVNDTCSCEENWSAPGCSACKYGYGGPGCTATCPVEKTKGICAGHGVCNTTDGSCSCQAGWSGVACQDTCTDQCSGHGDCSGAPDFKCTCHGQWDGPSCAACKPPYSGKACDLVCPVGHDGKVCSGRGLCINGTCHCFLPACGDSCGVNCTGRGCGEDGVYGVRCDQQCPGKGKGAVCSNHGVCSDGPAGNGACLCTTGYGGTGCNTTCHCGVHGSCDTATGLCVCVDGYFGSACEETCPSSTFGECSGHGKCKDRVCHCEREWGGAGCEVFCGCINGRCNASGVCECTTGATGEQCEQCTEGWHGVDCRQKCHNGTTVAAPIPYCNCTQGWSGANCTEPCPEAGGNTCAGHGRCLWGHTRTTGVCVCEANWYGRACAESCSKEQCERAFPKGGVQCSPLTGACECDSHHTGPECAQCSDLYWGEQCRKECQCQGKGRCDQVTGECVCYSDNVKGHFEGELCRHCAQGWVGLPRCINREIKISGFPPLVSRAVPPQTNPSFLLPAPNDRLLLKDHIQPRLLLLTTPDIAWGGGDPPVEFNLSSSEATANVFGSILCPVVAGWLRGDHVFLLADGCRGVSPSLFRLPPRRTATVSYHPCPDEDLCQVTQVAGVERVIDSVWVGSGLAILGEESGLYHAFHVVVDQFGVLHSLHSSPALSLERATSIAHLNGTFYACGATSLQWGCDVLQLRSNRFTIIGHLQHDLLKQAVAVTHAMSHSPYLVLAVSLWKGSAVVLLDPVAERVDSVAELTDGNDAGVAMALDLIGPDLHAIYVATCATDTGDVRCKLHRTGCTPLGCNVTGVVNLDVPPSAIAIDPLRRLVYVQPSENHAPSPARLYVYAAWGVESVSPEIVDNSGGTEITLKGHGFAPSGHCYFRNAETPFTEGTATDHDSMTCLTPRLNQRKCSKEHITVDVTIPHPPSEALVSQSFTELVPGLLPVVYSVHPRSIRAGREATITVVGMGFMGGAITRCRFLLRNGTALESRPAVFVNGTTVYCLLPPSAPSNGTFITLSLDGQHFSPPVEGGMVRVLGNATALLAEVGVTTLRSGKEDTVLPDIRVYSVDEQYNKLLDEDKERREVTADIPGSYYRVSELDLVRLGAGTVRPYRNFTGETRRVMSSGVVVFSQLRFVAARAGEANIAFTANGMKHAIAHFHVVAGTPVHLVVLSQPYPYVDRITGVFIQGDVKSNHTVGPWHAFSQRPVVGMTDAHGSLVQRLPESGWSWMKVEATIVSNAPYAQHVGITATESVPSDGVVLFDNAVLPPPATNEVDYFLNFTSPTHPVLPVLSSPFRLYWCSDGNDSYMPLNATDCKLCPPGGTCNGTSVVVTQAGFWRGEDGVFYRCPGMGDACHEGQECGSGQGGAVCASCNWGYAYHFGGLCQECYHIAALILLEAGLLFLQGALLVMLWYCTVWPKRPAGSARLTHLASTMQQCIIFLQINSLQGNVALPVPDFLRAILEWEYRFSSGDIAQFSVTTCLIRHFFGEQHFQNGGWGAERYTVQVIYMALPVIVLLLSAVCFRLWGKQETTTSPLQHKGRSIGGAIPLYRIAREMAAVVASIMGLAYMANSLALLRCEEVSGRWVLVADTRVSCGTGVHHEIKIATIFFYVLYIIVAPLLSCWLIWSRRAQFVFLTGPFLPQYWWWYLVWWSRRISVSFAVFYVTPSFAVHQPHPIQPYLVTLLLIVYLALQLHFTPLAIPELNTFEATSLTLSIVTMQLAYFLTEQHTTATEVAAVLATLTHIAGICGVLLAIARALWAENPTACEALTAKARRREKKLMATESVDVLEESLPVEFIALGDTDAPTSLRNPLSAPSVA